MSQHYRDYLLVLVWDDLEGSYLAVKLIEHSNVEALGPLHPEQHTRVNLLAIFQASRDESDQLLNYPISVKFRTLCCLQRRCRNLAETAIAFR